MRLQLCCTKQLAEMISFTSRQKYYFYSGPMDMRKDIDTLTEGVQVTKMQIKEDAV